MHFPLSPSCLAAVAPFSPSLLPVCAPKIWVLLRGKGLPAGRCPLFSPKMPLPRRENKPGRASDFKNTTLLPSKPPMDKHRTTLIPLMDSHVCSKVFLWIAMRQPAVPAAGCLMAIHKKTFAQTAIHRGMMCCFMFIHRGA